MVNLSPRQLEVLELVAHGLSNKEICEKLCIEMSTLATYINALYQTFNISDGGKGGSHYRVKLALYYWEDVKGVKLR